MAEEITKYTVAVEFDSALKKLASFEKKMNSFSSKQTKSLKRQISLQKQLNKLKGAAAGTLMGGTGIGASRAKTAPRSRATTVIPEAPRQKIPKASQTAFADMLRQEEAQAKKIANTKDPMVFHLKLREQATLRQIKLEQRRVSNLEQAKNTLKRSALWLDKGANEAEREAKALLKGKIDTAKTADEVRNIVASTRSRLRAMKLQEKSLKKQSFLMQRMQSSSKQIAGNMLSAFAIAAVGAGVIRTGQDFEAVNNTMLAVSASSEQAGKNFKFVRDESFRLGLGLKESAKGFAKLLAARGDLSLPDTKRLFTGVAEMSTLLGLTADESSRATNAIQQMASKGVVSAKRLAL